MDWIQPDGARVAVEGYPARGRGGAGEWMLDVSAYAPGASTGEGFHGVMVDFRRD